MNTHLFPRYAPHAMAGCRRTVRRTIRDDRHRHELDERAQLIRRIG
jgi:hypothetical protein